MEDGEMKTFLLVTLVLFTAAPAWATYTLPTSFTIQTMPEGVNVSPTRPAIDAGRIVVDGYPPAPARGVVYQIGALAPTEYGASAFPNWITQPNGYQQNNTVGIAGQWAALGGAPTANSQNNPIYFLNMATNTLISYAATGGSTDEHFGDVNSSGEAIWVHWGNGFDIMYANLNTPAVPQVSIVNTGAGGDSDCPNWGDQSRRFTYSPDRYDHWVYDTSTGQNVNVYNNPAIGGPGPEVNVLRSRMSDDGNFIVWNERPYGEGQKRSNLMLQNVSNLAVPGPAINLTNDVVPMVSGVIREDPNIEIIDSNTAVIVWAECAAPEAGNLYKIMAAIITNLSTVPVLGTPVLVAQDTTQLHFPDMDGNYITWNRGWDWTGAGNGLAQYDVQYTWIPEPATFSLLVLGGLALARRR